MMMMMWWPVVVDAGTRYDDKKIQKLNSAGRNIYEMKNTFDKSLFTGLTDVAIILSTF